MSVAVHFPLAEIQSSLWWDGVTEGCEVFIGIVGLGAGAFSSLFNFLFFLLLFYIWIVLGLNICLL